MSHSLYVRPEEERRCRHIMASSERHLRTVLRDALNVGLLVLLAGSPANEDGQYGDLTPKELAERLQPFTLHILELLHQQGRTPALLTHLPAAGASPYRAAVPLSVPLPQNGSVNGTHAAAPGGNGETGDDNLLAELLDAGCLLVEQ